MKQKKKETVKLLNKSSKKNNKRPTNLNENDMSVEFLPTHLDNREVQLGINIETNFHPELKSDKKAIVKIVLNKLTDNPQYYSNLILHGKVNHPEAIELYTDLFRQRPFFIKQILRDPKEEAKSLIRSILKNKINEVSHIHGGNVSEKPEEVYVKPGVIRNLERYTWFQKGGWEQKDFPISDNPFGTESGYRTAYFIQKTPSVPVFNSTETEDFITANNKKNQPDIKTLNKIDIKNIEKSTKDLIKTTKPKKIKPSKLEAKITLIKQIIREELKRYLTEAKKEPLSKQLEMVATRTISHIENEKVKPENAKKILLLYKLLTPVQQEVFDKSTYKKAFQFMTNIENKLRQLKK